MKETNPSEKKKKIREKEEDKKMRRDEERSKYNASIHHREPPTPARTNKRVCFVASFSRFCFAFCLFPLFPFLLTNIKVRRTHQTSNKNKATTNRR